MGEDEVKNNTFGVKWLREDKPQSFVDEQALQEILVDLY